MHGKPPPEPTPVSKGGFPKNPFVFLVLAIVIFSLVVVVTVTIVNGG